MIKIYIAHNYVARNDEAVKCILGNLIAMENVCVTSNWLVDPEANAQMDIDDIDRSHALLLFTDQVGPTPGRGKFFELGYAYGTGKKCFLIGDNSDCVFYELPEIQWVRSVEEMIMKMKEMGY